MERVRTSQSTPEELTLYPPPSPGTLKKINRKKELSLTLQVRPVKKGKAFLHPRHSVAEVLGGCEAARLTVSQSTQKSNNSSHHISDNSLDLVLRVSDEVHRMVRSFEMTEVPRALLNEHVHRLASEAFPDQDDPMQQELWTQYMRLATTFVVDAMALNQKGTRIEKEPMDRDISRNNDDEDEDEDAENYSLFRHME